MATEALPRADGFWTGVLVGGIGVAAACSAVSLASRRMASADEITASEQADVTRSVNQKELIAEQLSRSRLFLGDRGHEAVSSAFVVVVGLGGVGSHAAHMLARSGVGRLRLIDFDNVTLSSLNRHAVATRADVGRPKTQVCADHFREFAPFCEIDVVTELYDRSREADLLGGTPDFVIDAIDDVKTKADLIDGCTRRGLRIVSALGAGAKADPTRIIIGSLKDTVHDPLALALRSELRTRWANKPSADTPAATTPPPHQAPALMQTNTAADLNDVRVVYSYEKPTCKLAALEDDQIQNPDGFGAMPNMRIRVVPVLGTQPAMFGQAAAAHVLTTLGRKPFRPHTVVRACTQPRTRRRCCIGSICACIGFSARVCVSHSGGGTNGVFAGACVQVVQRQAVRSPQNARETHLPQRTRPDNTWQQRRRSVHPCGRLQ
eukprot:m.368427 g.368427  ORF g.368427 m.368427 type:complete len:435 (-) comp20842_c1_seq37:639-1943(-)